MDRADNFWIHRRRFIQATAVGVSSLALPFRSSGAEIEFPNSSCGVKESPHKVLVAYASKYATTGGVAEAIGRELCGLGAACDVRQVKEVESLEGYTAVVVGGAARNLSWMVDAVDFVNDYKEQLSNLPVAYFITCLQVVPGQPVISVRGVTPKNETEEDKKARVRKYLDLVLEIFPEVKPVDIAVFKGALDLDVLSDTDRMMMKTLKFNEGDFRDWDYIGKWTREISPKILGK